MMSARMASSHTRQVIGPSIRIRHASTVPHNSNHGQQIYVYNHLLTNQVVYSLTKALKNNASLKQFPFNGKKTVPRALRKDLWSPLATISFASGANTLGLSTFQKLREYRRLHELQWDDSLMTNKEGMFVPKKKRGRLINDQKANSVADIAAVLGKIGTTEGEAIGLKGTKKSGQDMTKVEVKWINLLDAQFAETWSDNVVHDQLAWDKNNRDPKYWEKRWEALQEQKKEVLVHAEKGRKQQEFWAAMDEKRREWYASQGNLDGMKPRRVVTAPLPQVELPKAEDEVALSQEEKVVPLEKEQKQSEFELAQDKSREERDNTQGKQLTDEENPQADASASTESTTAARPRKKKMTLRQKRHEEKLTKAREYWAEQDRQRLEYYLNQGKSVEEMKPRSMKGRREKPLPELPAKKKLTPNEKLLRAKLQARQAAQKRDLWEAEEKIRKKHLRFTGKKDPFAVPMVASSGISNPPTGVPTAEKPAAKKPKIPKAPKLTPEQEAAKEEKRKAKEEKQKAYWADMAKKRLEWYASQGKTPPEKDS